MNVKKRVERLLQHSQNKVQHLLWHHKKSILIRDDKFLALRGVQNIIHIQNAIGYNYQWP